DVDIVGSRQSHDALLRGGFAIFDALALSIDQEKEAAKIVAKQNAKARAGLRLSFWIHFASYLMGIVIFVGINIGTGSNTMLWPLIWWTVGVSGHALAVVIVELATHYSEQIDSA
ncbi:MAG: 2TM domain-containing protein, partial [Pseudomonadota bacterium]